MALYPTLSVNGSFNAKTKEYLQRYMRVNGWYTGYVDAQWGKMSWQGLQRMCAYHGYYGGYIDGDPGPMTVKAFNKTIHYKFPVLNGDLRNVPVGQYQPFWTAELVRPVQNGLNLMARYNTTTYPLVIHT